MQGKHAIFAGLAAGILFVVALFTIDPAHAAEPFTIGKSAETIVECDPTRATCIKPPLSAVVVTNCGLAVALFIQLDATHLLRADPRQSDMFTNVDGHMVHTQAGPLKWDDAYDLAGKAVLSSHVVIPCTDGPQV